jgi:pyruvate,water dikinase
MSRYVLDLVETDKTQAGLAGGKGANLGELTRVDGVRVPAGFVVTTDAFRAAAGKAELPADVAAAITGAVERLGAHGAYAVRSSATAEDSPTASFAGQQDTFLNVVGPDEVLRRVGECFSSLFTERAQAYRQRHQLDSQQAAMAVVVQRMVDPQAAGVLFTADPVSGNRKLTCVEAVPGLGDSLMSGLVTPDTYQVRDGALAGSTLAKDKPVLTSAQLADLERLGRRIEAHFGCPQDIEWCLAAGESGNSEFQIVQSRPITTLFPVPEAADTGNHVYVSVGHQQMMTDPMKPLGISVWQLTAGRPMLEAGSRLFVDITDLLASPRSRASIVTALGTSDPLIGDALQTVLDRGDFIPEPPAQAQAAAPTVVAETLSSAVTETDPAIVPALIERAEASIAALRRDIDQLSGTALLDFIRADIAGELKQVLFAGSRDALTAGMRTSRQLNERLQEWLGEKNAVDALTQSVPYNVTSEMGLALLDVADAIRPHPAVVAFLEVFTDENPSGEGFLETLPTLLGGPSALDAITGFLGRYGMRCVGEIDITRPRWSEHPAALVPLIGANVRNFAPGEGKRRFDQGLRNAAEKEQELLKRLRELPGGAEKAGQAKRMIDQVRAFTGYREYPKYHMIGRYFLYKQALLREADTLARSGVLGATEDVFYLTFDELHGAVATGRVESGLIRRRRESFSAHGTLAAPRVMTSDGEAVAGRYQRSGVPDGALTGLPVSAGTVEGRARVVLDLASAALEPGDILVTAFTDPSWTPVFTTAAGLVTEVGGLMTHGAVIAREYGLPAVVGVQDATRLISDGQRIRVQGTAGYVELLP